MTGELIKTGADVVEIAVFIKRVNHIAGGFNEDPHPLFAFSKFFLGGDSFRDVPADTEYAFRNAFIISEEPHDNLRPERRTVFSYVLNVVSFITVWICIFILFLFQFKRKFTIDHFKRSPGNITLQWQLDYLLRLVSKYKF